MDLGVERLIGRKDGSIGWMIFNHPERRNAISLDMWEAIPGVLSAFEADPDIRVVIYRGSGDKAFVSGADISQFGESRGDAAANAVYSDHMAAANRAMFNLSKPSIAMIRGFCIGGGLATALTCDIRISATDGQFGIPAARLGLGYGFEGVRALVDLVGPSRAKEILFSAARFDARQALEMGLINRVVAIEDLEPETRRLAAQMSANAPLTLRAAKVAVAEAVKDPERRDLGRVQSAIDDCFRSQDYAEGRKAFGEKRAPVFRGV